MSNTFGGAQLLGGLNISSFDTSSVTTMFNMFNKFENDGSVLDLKHFDTSQVTNMTQMFSLIDVQLDISTFNTSNVTQMFNMFNGYTHSLGVDVSSFDTSKVEEMTGMFAYYTSSQPLNLSHFNTAQVNNFASIFGSFDAPSLNLNGWDVSGFVEPTPNQYMHPYGLDHSSSFYDYIQWYIKILYCDQPGGTLWGQACTTGP